MKLLRKPTAAAVFTLLAATGISTLSPVAQAAPGRRIVLAVKGEPQQGFDPIKGWGRYGNPLFYSTLIKRNAKLDLVGDLATKWSLSADGKTWTINLREGVKFADGKPLTAEDVIYTFETAKKSAGLIDLNVVESVRAPNPSTVEIKLKEPRITFLNRLTTLGIVPKHAYNDAFGNTPMGSGPFKFVSWSKGQQLIVEPNSQYYGNKSGFERITFLFTEEDASLAAARAGQLHLVAVPHGFANQVPSKMKLSVAKSVDNRGIMFPMQPATGRKTADGNPIGNDITSDAAIRKAINIAINRQALAKGALNGYGAPAWGSADGLPWDNPQQRMSDSDMAAAKAILKQGGWVESGGKLTKNGKEARFPLLYQQVTVRGKLLHWQQQTWCAHWALPWSSLAKAGMTSNAKCTAAPLCLAGAHTTPLRRITCFMPLTLAKSITTQAFTKTPLFLPTLTQPNAPLRFRHHCLTGKKPNGTAKQATA